MKLAGMVLIAGFVLSAAGFASLLLTENIELKGDETIIVPGYAEGYAYVEVDMGTGGPIAGTFECLNGTSVVVSIMDEGQFDRFTDGLDDDARTAVLGESGEFSVDQVDMEVCYIVVEHAPGTESEQVVSAEYTVTNTDFSLFIMSMGLVFGGSTVVFLAFYSRQRADAKMRKADKKYTDVTFFDE